MITWEEINEGGNLRKGWEGEAQTERLNGAEQRTVKGDERASD